MAVICKFSKLFPNYLNSNTIKGSVTSATPFQAVPAGPPPAPTSAGDAYPSGIPSPVSFPGVLVCWLNSVEHRALNTQLPVFLAKKRGKIHPSGGDPESCSSPGRPLDDTSAPVRSGRPVAWTPSWSAASGLTRPAGGGMVVQAASYAVPPPEPRNPCTPSPASRTLLPWSGSPRTTGQVAAWLRSRKPWWPLRCCLPAPSGLSPLPAPASVP